MINRTRARIGAAVIGGVAVAGAIPAYAAVSASSPPAGVAIELTGAGSIIARGAATSLQLRVTCPTSSYYAYVYGSVTQKSGSGVAQGTGGQQVRCTNVPEIVTLNINATSGGKAFKAGTAAANASLDTYTRKGAVYLQVDGTVTLKK